jgi:hypothetical protein
MRGFYDLLRQKLSSLVTLRWSSISVTRSGFDGQDWCYGTGYGVSSRCYAPPRLTCPDDPVGYADGAYSAWCRSDSQSVQCRPDHIHTGPQSQVVLRRSKETERAVPLKNKDPVTFLPHVGANFGRISITWSRFTLTGWGKSLFSSAGQGQPGTHSSETLVDFHRLTRRYMLEFIATAVRISDLT